MSRALVNNKKSIFNGLVVFLIVWCALQDFLLPIVLKLTGSVPLVKVLFFSKDVLLIILFAYAFVKTRGIRTQYVILTIAFMTTILVYLVVGMSAGVEATSALSSFRGWILLPCLFYIGYALEYKKTFIKVTLPKIFRFYVVLALLGIAEYYLDIFVGTKTFWTDTIGLTEYMDEIKGQAGRLVDGLPGNFYGSYGGGFLTQKRLCGVWASPLAAAYNFIFPICYYFILFLKNHKIKNLLGFGIVYFALVLTMTRAIILLSIPVLFFILFYYFVKFRALLIVAVIIAGVVVFFALNDKIMGYIFDQSTSGHLESLEGSLSSLDSIFGAGLATYGVGTAVGTESAYISCFGQLGLLGLVLYVWLILAFVLADYRMFKATRSVVIFAILISTAAIFLTGLISEQIIAYTSSVLGFVLMGLIARPKVSEEIRYGKVTYHQRVSRQC